MTDASVIQHDVIPHDVTSLAALTCDALTSNPAVSQEVHPVPLRSDQTCNISMTSQSPSSLASQTIQPMAASCDASMTQQLALSNGARSRANAEERSNPATEVSDNKVISIESGEMTQDGDDMRKRRKLDKRVPYFEAPEFVRRMNVFEEVDLGGTIIFECQCQGYPRPVSRWFLDEVEVTSCDPSSRVFVDRSEEAGQGVLRLVVKDAQKSDEGAYKCKSENQEGVASTTGYLSVTGSIPSPSSASPSSSSPRSEHAVSSPPLLRAITEQQSMEEREAAAYEAEISPLQQFIENVERGATAWPYAELDFLRDEQQLQQLHQLQQQRAQATPGDDSLIISSDAQQVVPSLDDWGNSSDVSSGSLTDVRSRSSVENLLDMGTSRDNFRRSPVATVTSSSNLGSDLNGNVGGAATQQSSNNNNNNNDNINSTDNTRSNTESSSNSNSHSNNSNVPNVDSSGRVGSRGMTTRFSDVTGSSMAAGRPGSAGVRSLSHGRYATTADDMDKSNFFVQIAHGAATPDIPDILPYPAGHLGSEDSIKQGSTTSYADQSSGSVASFKDVRNPANNPGTVVPEVGEGKNLKQDEIAVKTASGGDQTRADVAPQTGSKMLNLFFSKKKSPLGGAVSSEASSGGATVPGHETTPLTQVPLTQVPLTQTQAVEAQNTQASVSQISPCVVPPIQVSMTQTSMTQVSPAQVQITQLQSAQAPITQTSVTHVPPTQVPEIETQLTGNTELLKSYPGHNAVSATSETAPEAAAPYRTGEQKQDEQQQQKYGREKEQNQEQKESQQKEQHKQERNQEQNQEQQQEQGYHPAADRGEAQPLKFDEVGGAAEEPPASTQQTAEPKDSFSRRLSKSFKRLEKKLSKDVTSSQQNTSSDAQQSLPITSQDTREWPRSEPITSTDTREWPRGGPMPTAHSMQLREEVGNRELVEFDFFHAIDWLVEWSSFPWNVYVGFVLTMSVLATAMSLDPAAVILIVAVVSAVSFKVLLPTSPSMSTSSSASLSTSSATNERSAFPCD